MRDHRHTQIKLDAAAEADYSALANKILDAGLWKRANSSFIGGNVPGKRVEAINFMGGVPLYIQMCLQSAEAGYRGFMFSDQ